jgi:hypothetical protein
MRWSGAFAIPGASVADDPSDPIVAQFDAQMAAR